MVMRRHTDTHEKSLSTNRSSPSMRIVFIELDDASIVPSVVGPSVTRHLLVLQGVANK